MCYLLAVALRKRLMELVKQAINQVKYEWKSPLRFPDTIIITKMRQLLKSQNDSSSQVNTVVLQEKCESQKPFSRKHNYKKKIKS